MSARSTCLTFVQLMLCGLYLFVLERLCAPSPGPALRASIISLLFVSPLLWSAYFWRGGHIVIKEDSDRLVL